jgi:AraC-like DNA-binding protein
MTIKNLQPSNKVAAWVERILVIENYAVTNSFSLPLFANGSPTLLFNSARGVMKNKLTNNLTLFGQTILPEAITFNEDFILVAYFFKPYSLLPLFKVAAVELTDNPVDIGLLGSQRARTLQDQLLSTAGTASLIQLLDDYISNLISNSTYDISLIRYATTSIAKNSKGTLVSLQKELHTTERTFQRMFEKHIGIAPRVYRRVARFNAAFQQLNSRNFCKLSDLAFEHGYADQSHFIRTFKEFTNLTPNEYLHFGD